MSEHTKTPWAYCDHGVGELVVYCPQTEDAICTFDDTDTFWAWKERYFVSGEAEANARHIVHCVNNHERLVEALREAVETIEDQYDSLWSVAGYGKKPPCKDSIKARTLLAALEAEKGGEL